MKNARWFRIVCATLTYIYTIAVCSTSEVVEELVCMGRWRPPGALHVHLGSVAAQRAAAQWYQMSKPARNRFTSVCYIVISRFFKTTFNNSVSRKWMNFIFKIRQIVAGIS